MDQDLYLDSDDEGTQKVIIQFISSGDYDFFNKISEDAIYEYFKVRKISTGEIYTAKTLKKEDIKMENIRNFLNEVEFLHQIKSQFVIKCLGFNSGDESQTPFYIFEYYSNGTLYDLFKSKKKD